MQAIEFLSITAQANIPITASKEVSDGTFEDTYLAFGKKGANSLSDPAFSVCRYRKEIATSITQIMWADGTIEQLFAFDNPEILNYSFLK